MRDKKPMNFWEFVNQNSEGIGAIVFIVIILLFIIVMSKINQ